MPDRILRATILTSDRLHQLHADGPNWAAENFFRRLMSAVDDFARFDGRPSVILAATYPLMLGQVTAGMVGQWLQQCVAAGLVVTYEVDGKPYLYLPKFRNRVRAKRSRYPDPPDGDRAENVTDNGSTSDTRPSHDGQTPGKCTAHDNETETEGANRLPSTGRSPVAGGASLKAEGIMDFLITKGVERVAAVEIAMHPSSNLALVQRKVLELQSQPGLRDWRAVLVSALREQLGDDVPF